MYIGIYVCMYACMYVMYECMQLVLWKSLLSLATLLMMLHLFICSTRMTIHLVVYIDDVLSQQHRLQLKMPHHKTTFTFNNKSSVIHKIKKIKFK